MCLKPTLKQTYSLFFFFFYLRCVANARHGWWIRNCVISLILLLTHSPQQAGFSLRRNKRTRRHHSAVNKRYHDLACRATDNKAVRNHNSILASSRGPPQLKAFWAVHYWWGLNRMSLCSHPSVDTERLSPLHGGLVVSGGGRGGLHDSRLAPSSSRRFIHHIKRCHINH